MTHPGRCLLVGIGCLGAVVNGFTAPMPPVRRVIRDTSRWSSAPTDGGPSVPTTEASCSPGCSDSGDLVLDTPVVEKASSFIVDITTPEPIAEELAESNLVKIVRLECSDHEVNWLAWKCLGYRYLPTEGRWDNSHVFPKWAERYPEPPDLVGVTRVYEKEVDAPVKKANTALVRSVPKTYKQSLKELLAPYGFKGFKVAELTPNRTRRAQVCNWLLYYKRDLWGRSLEDLLARKNDVTAVTREGETSDDLGKKMVY